MLQSNEQYFEIAKNNPELIFDERYAHTECDTDIADKCRYAGEVMMYMTELKRKKADGTCSDADYEKLRHLARRNEAQHSPFGAFVTACDTTLAAICDDFAVFKTVVDLYLQRRIVEVCSCAEMWIQAQTDKGVSRHGVADKIFCKLASISAPHGFVATYSAAEFLSKAKAIVRLNSKLLGNTELKQKLSVDEDTPADILLKNGDQFILIAAKHLKVAGGAQDDQFQKLKDFLSSSPAQENVRFGAFLDGIYSNAKLAEVTEREEIRSILDDNPNSFWFNTAGFTQFIADFAT